MITGLTVTGIIFEFAVAGAAHAALEVMTTETLSPLTRLFEVNAAELFPALTPFIFHW
jgi:hypothetical protein